MKDLGITYAANHDYFPDLCGNTLFKKISSDDTYDYLITDCPENFLDDINGAHKNNKKIIILDSKDEWIRHSSTQLISICYKYFMTTSKIETQIIKPFCFSITLRMMQAAESAIQKNPWNKRTRQIAYCHRVTNHSVRNYALQFYKASNTPIKMYNDNCSQPTDEDELHWWKHTGRRHSNKYYDFISSCKFIDAHGGYFKENKLTDICQWDSWKVWEGFLCGCAVITADFDYYKIKLPFPLKPYVHYLPVRYDEIQESYRKIFKFSDSAIEKIAKNGREFILQHYNPKEFSRYILEKIEN